VHVHVSVWAGGSLRAAGERSAGVSVRRVRAQDGGQRAGEGAQRAAASSPGLHPDLGRPPEPAAVPGSGGADSRPLSEAAAADPARGGRAGDRRVCGRGRRGQVCAGPSSPPQSLLVRTLPRSPASSFLSMWVHRFKSQVAEIESEQLGPAFDGSAELQRVRLDGLTEALESLRREFPETSAAKLEELRKVERDAGAPCDGSRRLTSL
jgi:hypothetical protein